MTVLAGVTDRTPHTGSIERSGQRNPETGEPIPVFRGRRSRPLAGIDSIVLHQTGFWQSARGDDLSAYDRMIAHFVLLPNGTVLQLRELEARLNSASLDYGVDIEVVGCFNDDSFDCETYRRLRAAGFERPRGCSLHAMTHCQGELPSLAQIESGRRLIGALAELEAIPDRIRYILAHRQITGMGRGNCPGPHLWYNLGHWAETRMTPRRLSSSRRSRDRPIPPTWQDGRFALPPSCTLGADAPMPGEASRRFDSDGVLALAERRPGAIGA
jgi:hypothetical protein